jgi:hypothetical protein
MRDFEDEIRVLREKTKSTRRQFLLAEVQTCSIALERAQYELSLGNTDEARKELAVAGRGVEVARRFLNEAAGPMPEIESELAHLDEGLESLRLDLDRLPH